MDVEEGKGEGEETATVVKDDGELSEEQDADLEMIIIRNVTAGEEVTHQLLDPVLHCTMVPVLNVHPYLFSIPGFFH